MHPTTPEHPHHRPTRTALRALVLTASIILAGCSTTNGEEQATFDFYAPGGQTLIRYPVEERKPVQDFSGPSLMDNDATISLSDFDGQVVVLNSWGQWCGPCRTEADDLEEVHERISPQKATVLGINVRDYNPEVSRDFVHDSGLTYPSIYDPPFKTATALGGIPATVTPTTIVLDKQHRPAAVFLREITAKELLEVVQPIIDEPADNPKENS